MSTYRVAVISRPAGWVPEGPDDVPPAPQRPMDVLAEADELFSMVARAVAFNQQDVRAKDVRWAVVIDPGRSGRLWADARLCTPIRYKVATVWWPDGWEPSSPLDVPNCTWQAQGQPGDTLPTYREAEASVRALNRQCMDQPGTLWYVLAAVENEPVSRAVTLDAMGSETTVEVRPLHVIRPEAGSHGDCSYCPAHAFPCAEANWTSRAQPVTAAASRGVRG